MEKFPLRVYLFAPGFTIYNPGQEGESVEGDLSSPFSHRRDVIQNVSLSQCGSATILKHFQHKHR